MFLAPKHHQSNGRLASRSYLRFRKHAAAMLIAMVGSMTLAGNAQASSAPMTGGLTLADATASADAGPAALPIAPSPIATSDVGTDSLAGSGIACIIVTLAALASGGDDDKKKGRGRTRTDE